MQTLDELISLIEPNQETLTEDDLANLNNNLNIKKEKFNKFNEGFVKKSITKNFNTNNISVDISDKIKLLMGYYYKISKHNNSFLSSIMAGIDKNFYFLKNKKTVICEFKKKICCIY